MAKILVIEDEDDIRSLLEVILEGHETTLAINGKNATEILKEGNTFDLIITDLRMPLMGGKEFIWNFRKENKNTPIIVMSGFVTDLSDCQTLGIQGSLMKPARGDQITALVDSILSRSKDSRAS